MSAGGLSFSLMHLGHPERVDGVEPMAVELVKPGRGRSRFVLVVVCRLVWA